jgi:hypothetical protein
MHDLRAAVWAIGLVALSCGGSPPKHEAGRGGAGGGQTAEAGAGDGDGEGGDGGGALTPVADAAAPVDANPVARDAAGVEAPAAPAVDTRGVVSATVSGYQLLVRRRNADGSVTEPAPYDLRGISWSPGMRGGGMPDIAGVTRAADLDFPLMRGAGINTVKTYGPVERAVLDKMLAQGMLAIVTVLLHGDDDFAGSVTALRSHPAVLMWLVGNEWNQNHLYGSCAGDACYARVNDAARAIKGLDPAHPVATSFAPSAELPAADDLRRLDAVDVWGLNVYSQPGFFNRFLNWRQLGASSGVKKPFFMSEYGADAFDSRAGREDDGAQAAALRQQTSEIRGQSSARNPALPCLGGTPFEWNDEWWKTGSAAVQDASGFSNRGVAPDGFANEDWWGVVDIDRKPRAAYRVLQELYVP